MAYSSKKFKKKTEKMETTSYQIVPIFDGENYDSWRIKIKTILKTKKLWEVVENGVPTEIENVDRATQRKTEEASLKDLMAL